jgi:hypothetical protein
MIHASGVTDVSGVSWSLSGSVGVAMLVTSLALALEIVVVVVRGDEERFVDGIVEERTVVVSGDPVVTFVTSPIGGVGRGVGEGVGD